MFQGIFSHLCRPCTSQWPARSGSGGVTLEVWMSRFGRSKSPPFGVAKAYPKNQSLTSKSNWLWKDMERLKHHFPSLPSHSILISWDSPPLGTLQIWMPTRGRGCLFAALNKGMAVMAAMAGGVFLHPGLFYKCFPALQSSFFCLRGKELFKPWT